ncbi:hypothetical protein INR49_026940 [Caranx melampygus]|nr:hypothetical protein INR49_026940 [Caranx melampygus]
MRGEQFLTPLCRSCGHPDGDLKPEMFSISITGEAKTQLKQLVEHSWSAGQTFLDRGVSAVGVGGGGCGFAEGLKRPHGDQLSSLTVFLVPKLRKRDTRLRQRKDCSYSVSPTPVHMTMPSLPSFSVNITPAAHSAQISTTTTAAVSSCTPWLCSPTRSWKYLHEKLQISNVKKMNM